MVRQSTSRTLIRIRQSSAIRSIYIVRLRDDKLKITKTYPSNLNININCIKKKNRVVYSIVRYQSFYD